MRITQITVEYGCTWNLGSYSSVRPALSLTAELEEGESPDQVRQELHEQAKSHVEAAIDAALVQTGQKPQFGREALRQAQDEEIEVAF
jgi:hypothetical protein